MNYDSDVWLKSYDDWVEPDVDVQQIPLAEYFEKRWQGYYHRPAINFLGTQMTYDDINQIARQFAEGLSSLGLGKGDVIAIHMPNLPQFLIATLGALKIGCLVSGVSPLLTPKEVKAQLNDCEAKLLVIMDILFEPKLVPIKDELPHLKHLLTVNVADYLPRIKKCIGRLLKKIPHGKTQPILGKEINSFTRFCARYDGKPPKIKIAPEDPCFLVYTGGTTGPAKGATLTNANAVSSLIMAKTWVEPSMGKERALTVFPLFHVGGLITSFITMNCAGEQTLIPNPRDTKAVIKEWKALKPTYGVMAPSLFTLLLEDDDFHQIDFSSMKYCYTGSAPFSVESLNQVEKLIGVNKITEAYGMTENCGASTANPLKGKKKPGSVGLPYPSTLVKIVDLETGLNEMPLGEPGELIVHGPQVMMGYHKKPDETKLVLREHEGKTYLHTGDVAYMDEDGYLWIVDRVKDMLIVGGYKVFSSELESQFYTNPAVKFCAIIGVPNPDRPGSELVKLMVQKCENHRNLDDDILKKELGSYAKENMAPYKVPKMIEIIESMPLTPVGKVDKKALRK